MPRRHEWDWLFEELQDEPSFVAKTMFGCRSVYLDGKLVFVLAENANESNWNGLLVPTNRESHLSLTEDFPQLGPHKILGKWLYLNMNREDFEETAQQLIVRVLRRDARFGVIPEGKKTKSKKSKAKKAAKNIKPTRKKK